MPRSAADILPELIRFRTVNPGGDEVAVCEHLADELRRLGADDARVEEVEREGSRGGYVYARFGTPRLLVNAHVDTVPVNAGWRGDPFEARIEDGRLYGLGSADTKGAIAAALAAIERCKPQGVGFLFSGDEERTGTCVPAFLRSGAAEGISRAIVCEPTARRAGTHHRGVIAYRATINGKGGHSSRADYMPKPLVAMSKLAISLDELARARIDDGPPDMRGLALNVAEISGGVAFNVVPERAELTFSVRPFPGFDKAEFDADVAARARAIDPSIEIACVLDHQPLACRDEGALRELLGDLVEAYVGLDFWTEAAVLADAGIEAVVVGPGDIAMAHSPGEYVPLEDLEWATTLFESVFASMSGSG
jgi:acetylornithine deacetylase